MRMDTTKKKKKKKLEKEGGDGEHHEENSGGKLKENLYQMLGVEKDASDVQIKAAYRKLALKHHPDKKSKGPTEVRTCDAVSEASVSAADDDTIFKRVSFAYSVLSDPAKKKYYDETGDTEDVDVTPEDFVRTFQVMMAEMMGGVSVKEMTAGLSRQELAAMPPFPFPKELFPPGTFPEGMTFSSDGLENLPPQVEAMLANGELTSLVAPGVFASAEEMTAYGSSRADIPLMFADNDDNDNEDEDEDEDFREFLRERQRRQQQQQQHAAQKQRTRTQTTKRGSRSKPSSNVDREEIMSEILSAEFLQNLSDDPMFQGMPPEMIGKLMRSMTSADPSMFDSVAGVLDDDSDDEDDDGQVMRLFAQQSSASTKPTKSVPASRAHPTTVDSSANPADMSARNRTRKWMEAAKAGDTDILKDMLESDSNIIGIRGPGVGHTALHWAAARGQLASLRFLLHSGANPTDVNHESSTPLHAAAAHGHSACVDMLINEAAPKQEVVLNEEKRRKFVSMKDEDGLSAADIAQKRGHAVLAEHLRQFVRYECSVEPSISSSAVRLSSSVSELSTEGTDRERSEEVKSDGDYNKKKTTSPSPPPVITELDSEKAETRATPPTTITTNNNHTDESDESHRTSEPVATPSNEAPTRHVTDANVRVSSTGVSRAEGRRWLSAAKAGELSTLKLMLADNVQLLTYRGQGTSFGFTGSSALHWASAKGHINAILFLLEQGLPSSLVNNAGSTALHAACANGQIEAAEVLVIAGGADVRVADALGESPRDGAASRGNDALVYVLDASERARQLLQKPEMEWSVRELRAYLSVLKVSSSGAEKTDLIQMVRNMLEKVTYRRIVPVREIRPCDIAIIGDETRDGDPAEPSSSSSEHTTMVGAKGADDSAESHNHRREGIQTEAHAPGDSIAVLAKERGNTYFRNGEYARAAVQYSMFIRLDPKNAVGFSNRSGAYAKQGLWQKALDDAETCVKLRPSWGKAHARKGAALVGLGQAGEGVKAYLAGISADPDCASLKDGLKAAKKAIQDHQRRFEEMWGSSESKPGVTPTTTEV